MNYNNNSPLRKRFPPYSEYNMKFMMTFLKERSLPSLALVKYLAAFGLGIASVFIYKRINQVRA